MKEMHFMGTSRVDKVRQLNLKRSELNLSGKHAFDILFDKATVLGNKLYVCKLFFRKRTRKEWNGVLPWALHIDSSLSMSLLLKTLFQTSHSCLVKDYKKTKRSQNRLFYTLLFFIGLYSYYSKQVYISI